MTSGAHKLVRSEPYMHYRYEIWHFVSSGMQWRAEKN